MAMNHSFSWPGLLGIVDVELLHVADDLDALLGVVAGGVHRGLVADDQAAALARRRHFFAIVILGVERHAGEQLGRRQVAAVVPVHRERGAAVELGKLELDLRPLRVAVAVVPGALGLDRDRVAQVEGHERHVAGVAGHVAQRAGAEVPPAAPGERMIAVAVRPLRRRAEPDVPVERRRAPASIGGPALALRPDRAIGPDVDFLDRADLAGAESGAAALRIGSKAVPWLPICVATPFSRAISPSRRASQIVCVSGFWQWTCLPIRIAFAAITAWLWSGVLTVTASMLSPILSSILRKSVKLCSVL